MCFMLAGFLASCFVPYLVFRFLKNYIERLVASYTYNFKYQELFDIIHLVCSLIEASSISLLSQAYLATKPNRLDKTLPILEPTKHLIYISFPNWETSHLNSLVTTSSWGASRYNSPAPQVFFVTSQRSFLIGYTIQLHNLA